ncbi:MAG TPA: alginate lyase family protein [Burkholderiales bacterium]
MSVASYLRDGAPQSLACLARVPSAASLAPHAETLFSLARQAIAHEFDLLGSGPAVVRHGMRCRGLGQHRFPPGAEVHAAGDGAWLEPIVNPPNLAESRRIWSLVDQGYAPIDWHIDFKSGFRWPVRTWYRDVPVYANPRGADIKLPWELARCQHLPRLALAYSIARESNAQTAKSFAREFRNQVLDFVSANPPRYGVNWACTMEVAIRAANWVIAHDFFRASGAAFDPEFEALIARSIREHGLHIATNLEWSDGLRGNHYLADICGLLFVAAHLPPDESTDAWLALALQELLREVQYQFNPEGSNVEASTSYHRLSGEMTVYCVALALGLPKERLAGLQRLRRSRFPERVVLDGPPAISESGELDLPEGLCERIARIAEFTRDLTLPNGAIAQFGDNDSGRFFKLPGTFRRFDVRKARDRYSVPDLSGLVADYLDEDVLDHRHFVAAANALLGRDDLGRFAAGREIDTEIIGLLSGGRRLPAAKPNAAPTGAGLQDDFERMRERIRGLPEKRRQRYEFTDRGRGLQDRLSTVVYPAFGLYIVRSERLYLAIRCGRLHPRGAGAHAHNDQLAIELWIDGQPFVTDPGTWVYTPLPDERNRYRSAGAHFAPRIAGREPSRLDEALFVMRDSAHARCVYFGRNGFAGEHVGFGAPVLRAITLEADRVIVEDGSLGEPLVRLEATPRLPVSNKYGCQLA